MKKINGGMKLETLYAKTKARKISDSTVSTLPKPMCDLLGIKPGTPLNVELNPDEGVIKIYKVE
jgi:bifunctional DNA-binding transcriptional regulator/antitoxin component of YhaV-PrlF toxin-antitoxin module